MTSVTNLDKILSSSIKISTKHLNKNRLFFLSLCLILEKKKIKYTFRYSKLALLFGIISFVACGSDNKKKHNTLIGDLAIIEQGAESGDTIRSTTFDGNYDRTFNDLHELHMVEASKNGFAPMPTRKDTSRMKGKVVYYKPAVYENFIVDSLPHSMPVMVPAVAKLINEIGIHFRDSLKKIDYPDCKIIVTSITRTDEDIRQLRRKNGNAIEDSAHRFGTTFDISWIKFHQVDTLDTRTAYDRVLKKTLGNVLHKMRQEKKCYIKHESHQMCFHITVRQNK